MDTRILGEAQVAEAAALLRSGALVAFPTETVYGLGADATNDAAVRGIYEAKGRPSDNPLIVHFGSLEAARAVVEVAEDSAAWRLARAFWPGPLTLVLPQRTATPISRAASAGLPTLGVRVPGNELARRLIDTAGVPIAAPSANRSGKPSPTCAAHVADDLRGRVAAILEGEVSEVGVESTIVDGTQSPLVVLRPGGVTLAQLRAVVGDDGVVPCAPSPPETDGSPDLAPRAPGMKYVHYAPEAPVYFFDGPTSDCTAFITKLRDARPAASIALLTSLDPSDVAACGADSVVRCGHYERADTIARELYACLRQFDCEGAVGAIVCYGFPTEGVGEAVLNRLQKAAQKL